MTSQFRTTYIDNQMLAKISERCEPQFILSPDTAGEGPTAEPSAYAAKVAEFMEEMRKQAGVTFETTSIVNEPIAYPTAWLAQAASALRRELDSRDLQGTKIIAADWANVSYKSVQAISDFESDAQANAAIHAWSNHSYNMCSTGSMTIAARNKERWVTEAGQVIWDSYGTPAEVNVMDAANLAGRLLNDLNNDVTRWMYFIGFLSTTYPKAPSNPWCALVLTSPSGNLTAFNRYYYLKQLLETFPQGSVFHHAQSSLDGTMDWTYGQKPRMSAAAAEGPDGRLRVAIVNTTGILSNAISQYYPSQAFLMELELPWPDRRFHASITGTDGKTRSSGIIQSGRGSTYLALDPYELATLVEI
jgi:hypothetical protein